MEDTKSLVDEFDFMHESQPITDEEFNAIWNRGETPDARPSLSPLEWEELWPPEPVKSPVTLLICKINDFLSTVIKSSLDEVHYEYGNIVRMDIENAKAHIANHAEDLRNGLSNEQVLLVKEIMDGVTKLDATLVSDIEVEDVIGGKRWSDFLTEKQSGNILYSGWRDEHAEEVASVYSDDTTFSPFFLLRERCYYLRQISDYLYRDVVPDTVLNDLSNYLLGKASLFDNYIRDETQKIFAAKLSFLMKELGVSQTRLANAIGVTKSAVGQWCNGTGKASLGTLIPIAIYLKTSVDYLVRPYVNRVDLEEQHMEQHYGLTPRSVYVLKNKVKNKERIKALVNLIISNFDTHIPFDEESLDILGAIARYLNYYTDDYASSISELVFMRNTIDACSSVEEASDVIQSCINKVKRDKACNYIKLEEIINILKALKENEWVNLISAISEGPPDIPEDYE